MNDRLVDVKKETRNKKISSNNKVSLEKDS